MKLKQNKPKKIKGRTFQEYFLGGLSAFLFVILMMVSVASRSSAHTSSGETALVGGEKSATSFRIDVPTRSVSRGENLSSVPFTSVEWPTMVNASAFVSSRSQISDKFATEQLTAFSPIPLSAISDSGAEVNAVVEGIPQGFRAISVKVDVESSVEGWAQTGNYVDVIVLRQTRESNLGIEAKVIAENVKILSTGSTVEQVGQGVNAVRPPPTVTLLVSAEDALRIRTASTIGKLTFSLRGLGDSSAPSALSMNEKTLLGLNYGNSIEAKTHYKGQARGPDGKLYVLDSDSRWVKDIKELTTSRRDS